MTARETRTRDDDADVWVFAVADALAGQLPVPRREAPALPDGAETSADTGVPRSEAGAAAATAARALGEGVGLRDGGETQSASGSTEPNVPDRLITELSDSRLGRMELSVARGARGLAIVINVADIHVKALIEGQQGALIKTLQDCGLTVASVRIGHSSTAGTALAREGSEGARAQASLLKPGARWRAYQASVDEENDDEGLDFTA